MDGCPYPCRSIRADVEFAIFDFDWGWMMAYWHDSLSGHSYQVCLSFCIGADRAADASIEVGYKIIGW